MYKELVNIHEKPSPFSKYTAKQLWTEPHLANQMLQAHLSQETPMASRPLIAIERVVNWLNSKFELNGKSVCDLGCGPGLYAEKYAALGAKVVGLDFSKNSIEFAIKSAKDKKLDICYQEANYLEDKLPKQQDLISLIYCDLCALSLQQRQHLYRQIHESLQADGTFVFDVFSSEAFHAFDEKSAFGPYYMGNFWSEEYHYVFHNAFSYQDEQISLDHYTIIEENRTWDVYNWLQYFTHQSIQNELKANGFEVVEFVNGFDVEERNNTTFGVIAKPV
ncbi:hypothetical protein BCU68_12210 [Vibrio sp. 10N.286.49.B3]|uniref:class I SAM-dependent methyltransferase n=1 Tax=Vibrio sp. 10N.286.49.B3 TaxID=1880855 RepID=UPI000C86741E|nr:class I SAM-dependent methyltransferase [Vibrio sp. 10N.286.49.B3]PMH44899.1 hypothetical protein BCU68_12210 [Vibrio sp. 10N.286.49.B3]